MNLLSIYKDYQQSYRADSIAGRIRDVIQRNISGNHRMYARDFQYYQTNNAIGLQTIKTLRKQFAVLMSACIADNDPDTFLEYLNSREYRAIRQSIDDVHTLISNVFNIETYSCEDCGIIENQDNVNWAYDGDQAICNSCFEDYYYHERSGQYVHCDDDNYSNDDDEDNGLIGEYHSSSDQLGKIPSLFDKRKSQVFLGLELEMEVTSDYSRSDKAEMILNNLKNYRADNGNLYTYCLLENDGSLNNGFEMVTGYTGLDVHEKQLSFFKNPIRGLRSHDTQTCGLHIHIDKKRMSLNHATKMILFINDSGNQKLIKTIARRTSSRFAKIANKKADYSWLKSAKRSGDPLCNLNEDRYESLNFQNDNTVEFRLFKGTLKFESIMACLEFTYATWFFCKDYGYQDLTSENFIKFICLDQNKSDTKYLRAYLKAHLFDIPEVPKQNPRIVKSAQLVTDEV